MGTNYYYIRHPVFGLDKKDLHIGKSSLGWCFSLHVIPEEGLTSLDAWKNLFYRGFGHIESEYGERISADEMLEVILVRQRRIPLQESWKSMGYKSLEDMLEKNHAEVGPNGLLSHKVDGIHCVGKGNGTYNHIAGHFR